MKIITIVALSVCGIVAAALIAQRFSDGPTGPLKGGALRSGTLVTVPDVDWDAVLGDTAMGSIELQLVRPVGSRITGAFVHEGNLYVPCDLGFIWRRIPDDNTRNLLHLIWLLKDWHEDALRDGRVVVRVAGQRFERTAVRVTDPSLIAQFRAQVETAAEEFMGGLLPDAPDLDAIWFFRLDARAVLLVVRVQVERGRPGAGLDHDLVTRFDQRADALRNQRDTGFARKNFARYGDDHGVRRTLRSEGRPSFDAAGNPTF